MKYYVIRIEQYIDGSNDTKSIYEYVDLDSALSSFHTTIGGSMKNKNVKKVTCMMINANGDIFKNETWDRVIPEDMEPTNVTEETAI